MLIVAFGPDVPNRMRRIIATFVPTPTFVAIDNRTPPALCSGVFSDFQEIAEYVGESTTIFPTKALANDAQIEALESELAVKFPDDYRTFLRRFGSLFVSVDEAIWRRPKVGDVGPAWSQSHFEIQVFGTCSEADWMRIELETHAFRKDWGTDLTPVMAFANTSDRICFRQDGSLAYFFKSHGEVEPIDATFGEHLRSLLRQQRTYKEELRAR